MKEKKKNWLIGEIVYLLLAPFMVLAGILIYGILFDRWFKDPELILKASLVAYLVILAFRFLQWVTRVLGR
jgi:hypothetical protein